MTKRKRGEEDLSSEEEEEDFDQEEEVSDEEEEEVEDDNDNNNEEDKTTTTSASSSASQSSLLSESQTHALVKKSAQHRAADSDDDEPLTPLTASSGAARITDTKNLSSKEKARIKRQQLQDETIDKLLSKARDKNALNTQNRNRKTMRPYEPYDKNGKPIVRYVYSSNGQQYMLVPDDATLFPERPPHVKRRRTATTTIAENDTNDNNRQVMIMTTTMDAMDIDGNEAVVETQQAHIDDEKIRELEESLDQTFSHYFALVNNQLMNEEEQEEEEYTDIIEDSDNENENNKEHEHHHRHHEETEHDNKNSRRIRYTFRNYEPRDNHLRKFIKKCSTRSLLPNSDYGAADQQQKKSVTYFESAEEATQYILRQTVLPIIDQAKQSAKQTGDHTLQLIPQKVNFDLKRDVMKKLDILEKRTTKALAEILKEKLALEEEEDTSEDEESEEDNESSEE